MDPYLSIIGAAPTDLQNQQALVEQLRRRRSFGELGALTGDRVLQPFGQGMSKQADEYAKLIGANREKGVDDAQTKAYQDAQIAHMKALEGLEKRNQDLDHMYQMLMAQAALEKADKAGQQKPNKLTFADRNKLENIASEVNAAEDVMNSFSDEYAQKLGPGPQSRLPNALSAVGLSTKDMDKSANWWAKWKLLYTLPERNRTFGATLTPHEKAAWDEADINPSMDAKTIRDRVNGILKIVKNKGALMNKTYKAQFDPDVIDEYGLPDESNLLVPPGATSGHGAVSSKTPKRIKVDMQGNPIGN